MLCHLPCASIVLACLRPKAHKALCLCRLEKMSGLVSVPGHGTPCPCSSGRCRSLTTHAPLEASETCREAMGPEERQKPHQHAAGLLLFDDTAQCRVQLGDVSGGTYTRRCARAQSLAMQLSCSRDKSVLYILLVARASRICVLAVSATSLSPHREGVPNRRVRYPCWTDSAGRRMVVVKVSQMRNFAPGQAGRP
jgi:hypothetical protein